MAMNLNIKAGRATLDMIQKDFAEVVGVIRQTMNTIEKEVENGIKSRKSL